MQTLITSDDIRHDDSTASSAEAAFTTGRYFKERLMAALGLAVVALIVFHPLTLHPTEMLVGPQRQGMNDLNAYFIPSRQYPMEMMKRYGEFPLWNPYASFGRGYVGNPQSALYYPPNWICLYVEAAHALSWLLVLHHWWAGFGAYLLMRSLGCRTSSAFFAGAATIAGPYWVAHAGEGHYSQICAVSWIPWGLLAFQGVCSGNRLGVIFMSMILAMSYFCNHVQETFYLVLLLSAWLAARAVKCLIENRKPMAFALVSRWVGVGLLTAGLVSVDLIPSMMYTRSTVRAALRGSNQQVNSDRFLTQNYTQLLDPYLLGSPENYDVQRTPYCEMSLYLGLLSTVLAGVGIIGCRGRNGVSALSWMLAFTFLFALGRDGPLYPLMHAVVPGIAWFRAQSRILFFTQVLVSLLAGFGIEWIIRRQSDTADDSAEPVGARNKDDYTRFTLPLTVAIGYALAASLMIILLTPDEIRQSSLPLLVTIAKRPLLWVCLFAPAAIALMHDRFRRNRSESIQRFVTSGAIGMLTLLMLLETTSFAREALMTVVPISRSVMDELSQSVSFLAADKGERGSFPRVMTQHSLIEEQRSYEQGIHRLRGYDPISLTNSTRLLLHLRRLDQAPVEMMAFSTIDVETVRQNILSLYGVRYAVLPGDADKLPPPGWVDRGRADLPIPYMLSNRPQSSTDGQQSSVVNNSCRIWENPQALPRAFIVGHAELAANVKPSPDPQVEPLKQLDAQLDAFDPRESVLLYSDDLLPPGPRSDYRPAVVTDYSPNRVRVSAELDQPGYLVLTDLFHPGWSAFDNGKPVPILQGDIAFRVLPLAAGQHQIEFRYMTAGLSQGRFITLCSLAVLAILIYGRLKRPAVGANS